MSQSSQCLGSVMHLAMFQLERIYIYFAGLGQQTLAGGGGEFWPWLWTLVSSCHLKFQNVSDHTIVYLQYTQESKVQLQKMSDYTFV